LAWELVLVLVLAPAPVLVLELALEEVVVVEEVAVEKG